MIPEKAPSNATEWSVTELAGALKRTLEDGFAHVRVRGEISGYKGRHASGHAYFGIKDESCCIDSVVWGSSFSRLRFKPEEGLEVIATGKITTFPKRSKYQLVIEALEPAGAGALMALLDQRRRKLEAEGLFELGRKRKLPFLPRVIGVVTSPTGAVIRDILHRLEDRFPRTVLVWPVRVQGETAAAEVAAGIRGFNALPPGGRIPRPDIVIVARGGGSIEDLWSFNEEIVVRAAAASAIPLVSAIGHETDTTLIDLVADRRAPTPTGAAEIAVPVRSDLLNALADLARRHEGGIVREIETGRSALRSAARALPSPDAILGTKRQRLDLVDAKLKPALRDSARKLESRLLGANARLHRVSPAARFAVAQSMLRANAPRSRRALERLLAGKRTEYSRAGERLAGARAAGRARLADRHEQVESCAERLASAWRRKTEARTKHVAALDQLLASLNYRAVLRRGFALVRDGDGRVLRSAAATSAGQPIDIEFAEGAVRATVAGTPAIGPERAAPRRRAEPRPVASQGTLFDA